MRFGVLRVDDWEPHEDVMDMQEKLAETMREYLGSSFSIATHDRVGAFVFTVQGKMV